MVRRRRRWNVGRLNADNMTEVVPILEFDRVDLRHAAHGQSEMRGVSFRLMPGDLARVQLEPGNELLPLADAAEGLIAPDKGSVAFLGERWSALGADRELALRARIGRVFDGHGWISNLNVLENLTLAQRHHTARPLAEIVAEAQARARSFGLPEVPAGRPALVPRRDLRRAEWIRAFMGRPALILLERPTLGVAVEHTSLLCRAVDAALAGGAAALWIHDQGAADGKELPRKRLQFYMRGDTLRTEADHDEAPHSKA